MVAAKINSINKITKKITSREELIKELEKIIKNNRVPLEVRKEIRKTLTECLKLGETIPIPIITLRENDWIIASTPILDLSAQGKTKEEAEKNLEAMIDDYMTDPDTEKPKIKTIISMEIGITSIPMKLPYDIVGRDDNRKNTPIAAR